MKREVLLLPVLLFLSFPLSVPSAYISTDKLIEY